MQKSKSYLHGLIRQGGSFTSQQTSENENEGTDYLEVIRNFNEELMNFEVILDYQDKIS